MKTVKISSLYCQTTTWLDQQARHFNDEQDEYHNGYDERDGLENFAIQLWQTMINLYINSINFLIKMNFFDNYQRVPHRLVHQLRLPT